MWYEQWSSAPDFPAAAASTVIQSGATPEVTWEPWNPAEGVNQPAYSLSAIAAGNYDSYILTWAQEIRAWGHPLMLRFAQEMNGNWTPWDEGVNGNGPGSFVAAWDHVHAIFTAAGANNVTWVWSPDVVYPTSTPLNELWPGNSYVDAVALDGYNWGPVHPASGWQTFSQIFQESIDQVQQLTQDPLYIGEVASTELGGNKAAWITDMFATLAASPEIKGFVWFDFDKETNWPIDSSPESLAAFRAGLATYDHSTSSG
jgi:beta-mannanase